MTKPMTPTRYLWWLAAAFLAFALSPVASLAETPAKLELRDNWFLRSSAEVVTPPEVLSSTAFTPENWRQTRVPATVSSGC